MTVSIKEAHSSRVFAGIGIRKSLARIRGVSEFLIESKVLGWIPPRKEFFSPLRFTSLSELWNLSRSRRIRLNNIFVVISRTKLFTTKCIRLVNFSFDGNFSKERECFYKANLISDLFYQSVSKFCF